MPAFDRPIGRDELARLFSQPSSPLFVAYVVVTVHVVPLPGSSGAALILVETHIGLLCGNDPIGHYDYLGQSWLSKLFKKVGHALKKVAHALYNIGKFVIAEVIPFALAGITYLAVGDSFGYWGAEIAADAVWVASRTFLRRLVYGGSGGGGVHRQFAGVVRPPWIPSVDMPYALGWSSKTVIIPPIMLPGGKIVGGDVVFEPVHQIAIDRALAELSEADRAILREQQVVADEDQASEHQHRHSMRDGRIDPTGWRIGRPRETVTEARRRANEYVREKLMEARKLEQEGHHEEAMRELGSAIHTLQDSTSPSHEGFQPWGGPGSQSAPTHVAAERHYPGDDSALFEVTRRAFEYFKGTLPMPDDFFE